MQSILQKLNSGKQTIIMKGRNYDRMKDIRDDVFTGFFWFYFIFLLAMISSFVPRQGCVFIGISTLFCFWTEKQKNEGRKYIGTL